MLSKRMHSLFLTGIVVSCLSVLSCSTGPSKAEIAAKQAQIKKVEKQRIAEKILAEKKAARKIKAAKVLAKKLAVEKEDTMQMQSINVVELPKAEKLREVQATVAKDADGLPFEIPTTQDTYLITMEQKDKTHPFYGVGDERGFTLNGDQGMYVIARHNHPITFQVRTSAMHDFYISMLPKGWGAAAYRAGVTGQFTYKGDVTFTPNLNTPDVLYYACRNHNSMGGKIIVVDENVDLVALKQKLDAERLTQLALNKKIVAKDVAPKKVKQKIAYVEMLIRFKGKKLPQERLRSIQDKLNAAKSLEKQNDLAGALAMAQESAELFKVTANKIGPTEEELAEQQGAFNSLMITLEAFIDSHLASFKQAKEEGRKTVAYDSHEVSNLIVSAKDLADKHQYDAASSAIKKAERMVTNALSQMLHEQTIVYDLNFKTLADEFKYEANQYKGYAELIPVAIDVKKPRASSIKLMETYRKKAEFFRNKANESAEASRWEEAIVIIKDATIEIRRGLRVLGVSM